MARPNYDNDQSRFQVFLLNFQDEEKQDKYYEQLVEISNRQRRTLDVYLSDIEQYFNTNVLEEGTTGEQIAAEVQNNAKHYLKVFAQAADALMPKPTEDNIPQDVFDVLNDQRKHQESAFRGGAAEGAAEGAAAPSGAPADAQKQLPAALLRRYDVYLHPLASAKTVPLRKVTSQHIGHLVKVRGVVTHITDVKPLAAVVAYTDAERGHEIYQEVVGRTFMPLDSAPSGTKATAAPVMQTRGTKFVKFQEARIQELSDEVPEGATPRTLSIQMRGEICRVMKPGDEVIMAGIFLPEPFTGFRAMRAGLLTSTYLEAQEVTQVKTSYTQHTLTQEALDMINTMADEGDVYGRLARSIAPEIFGHEDVKKAMLLLMVGGDTRHLSDGMKLRGDVHVCLMGDPGVAKSQLLKYVTRTSPRAVYTTGKGSSGVGLTAAVMRNNTTKELVLEGGALVLADMGICCIDEFDKMEEGDRTAIHEVMEQQTVSIAKAGITTTLNTRTTLLAAANPAWGRYDKRRTPAENINLPAALLSRFDLLWLILDEVDADNDLRLATHVLNVHKHGRPPTPEGPPALTPAQLRGYIAQAKTHHPVVPPSLTEYVASIYAEMRQLEKSQTDSASTYTTPRTLLSILRLGQAMAKLRFDDEVRQADIDEALRLMKMSKSSLASSDADAARREDPVSLVYRLIREHAARRRVREVTWADINAIVAKHAVTKEQILTCISEYSDISVWVSERDQDGNPMVRFKEDDIEV